jgi:hypothetical protein
MRELIRRTGVLVVGLFVGLAVGGAIDLIGGVVAGCRSQVGFWTITLTCLIGAAACAAGTFAKGRRQRMAWSGKQS